MNKVLLSLVSATLISSMAIAQENMGTDQTLDEDTLSTQTTTLDQTIDVAETQEQAPININATHHTKTQKVQKRPLSESDKMRLMRARLEKQNELLVKKQMEQMRLRQEMEMAKRIQKTFDDSMKRLEETK